MASAAVNDRVRVFARIRPSASNSPGSPGSVINADDAASGVTVDEPACQLAVNGFGRETRTFTFDGVFGEASTQSDLYTNVGRPLVDGTIKGFRCALLAYGQTGAKVSLLQYICIIFQ